MVILRTVALHDRSGFVLGESREMAVVGSMKNLFIVVDPSQQDPMALDRALITARLVGKNMPPDAVEARHLHVYVAVDLDNLGTPADNPDAYHTTDWFIYRISTSSQDAR